MRFGLHLPNSGVLTSAADLVAMAVRAEEIGFARVWVFDHLFNPVELSEATRELRGDDYYNKADMPYYDALTTLSVVAGATDRIGLGTRVLLPVLRSPIVLAKQIGTLAALAGENRVVLGVGAGWLIEEFVAVDVPPEERFRRLEEHIEVMRNIWRHGITAHAGEFYAHPPAGFLPVPASPIPVLLGGSGPNTVKRVARYADGWALPNTPPGPDARSQLTRQLTALGEACSERGRDVSDLLLVDGAPIDAPEEHFDMLAELGIDEVDLMLTTEDDLDLVGAERFMNGIGARLSD